MYRKIVKPRRTTLLVNNSLEGEALHIKVQRMLKQGEPIKDGAPLIYTEEKDIVHPQHDIRTDRFEFAVEAMDHLTRQNIAKGDHAAATKGEAGDGDKAPGTSDDAPNTGNDKKPD